ncbi:DnaJ domain-containing protein [Hoeflea sp. YIM 152468]|uniref:DnaJ C-terminal domain-containing protein n=1 Tax=Hoeflea sp. YIM 152468 TaxID=3031759 RepID=UPI0023DCDF3B|nr:DnaJ C-terminal domain-containing protein [Hoeflea sp. YIM 152468]MDF1608584.1 DnaJ domain-containing protein [Hoeflea sp. YIM 152468]
MRSPYTVLGVNQTAKAGDIKSAYRQLAKIWHPDQNPDNPQAGIRFTEIAHAYKLLIDPALRQKYDDGQIDARGRRQARPTRGFSPNPFKDFRKPAAKAPSPKAAAGSETADAVDEAKFEDMVVHIFGDAAARKTREHDRQDKDRSGQRTKADAPGMDDDPLATLDALFAKWKSRRKPKSNLPETHHQVEISLETALTGSHDEIVFGDNDTVAFEVPAGATDGSEIKVPSPDPVLYGDAVVTVHHIKHDRLRSAGSDLHGDHAIELAEAVLGGSFIFEGLDGPMRVEVPEWSGSDTVLRIDGKGLPTNRGKRGALHVHLRVLLPKKPDPHLKELMRSSKKAWYI